MKTEKLVAKLDYLIIEIDNATDELMDTDNPEADKARTILMHVIMDLNAVIDDLMDVDEPPPPVSGAV